MSWTAKQRRRFWITAISFVALVYGLAFGVLMIGQFVPFLGTAAFLAGLMVWFVPGIVFAWTGLFYFHEFGASPNGWPGHVVMFVFYAGIGAALGWAIAWWTGRRNKDTTGKTKPRGR